MKGTVELTIPHFLLEIVSPASVRTGAAMQVQNIRVRAYVCVGGEEEGAWVFSVECGCAAILADEPVRRRRRHSLLQ